MPLQPPWSDTGRVQSDLHRLESEVKRKADDHEIYTLTRRLDSLEHTNRETRSLCNELLSRVQTMEEKEIARENIEGE